MRTVRIVLAGICVGEMLTLRAVLLSAANASGHLYGHIFSESRVPRVNGFNHMAPGMTLSRKTERWEF